MPRSQRNPPGGSETPRTRSFAVEAGNWSAEKFCNWLLEGYCSWHDPRDKDKRATAFAPAFFNPRESLTGQIMLIIRQLRDRQGLVFQAGLRDAIAAWSPEMRQSVLRDLVALAAYYKPVGLPRILRNYIFAGTLGSGEEADRTLLEMYSCLCAHPITPEIRDILVDVRNSAHWRADFAAQYLRAFVLAGELDWIEGLRELRREFEELAQSGELATTLDLLIGDIGGMQADAERLSRMFEARTKPSDDDWIVKALFEGSDPPIGSDLGDEGAVLIRAGEPNVYLVDLVKDDEVPDHVEEMRQLVVIREEAEVSGGEDVLEAGLHTFQQRHYLHQITSEPSRALH